MAEKIFTQAEFEQLGLATRELHKFALTVDGKIAIRVIWWSAGDMLKSENLEGLSDYAAARGFLGVYATEEVDLAFASLSDIYSVINHDHAWVYAPVLHNHDTLYAAIGHNHTLDSLSEKSYESLTHKPDLSVFQTLAQKNNPNGYVGLNASWLIDSWYLPSFVDDIIEVADFSSLPATGETGKMYVTLDTDKLYRWGGLAYSTVSSNNMSDAHASTLTNGSNADPLHTHTFASLTSKPTTISGYGITDAYTKTESDGLLSWKANLTGGNTFSWLQNINWDFQLDWKIRIKSTSIWGYTDVFKNGVSIAQTWWQQYHFLNDFVKGGDQTWDLDIFFWYASPVDRYEFRWISWPLFDILWNWNVWIGIQNPTEKLEITGNIKVNWFSRIYQDNSEIWAGAWLIIEQDGTWDAVLQLLRTWIIRWKVGSPSNNSFVISDSWLDTPDWKLISWSNPTTQLINYWIWEVRNDLVSWSSYIRFFYRENWRDWGFYNGFKTVIRYYDENHPTLANTWNINDTWAVFNQQCSLLTLWSTTKGFLPPKMTTTQKNAISSPVSWLIVYDTSLNKLQCYNGSTWNNMF